MINERLLKKFLGTNNEMQQEMIYEFKNKKEALEYLNTYCYMQFKSIEDMEKGLAQYGFSYKRKYYVILYDEALKVYDFKIHYKIDCNNGIVAITTSSEKRTYGIKDNDKAFRWICNVIGLKLSKEEEEWYEDGSITIPDIIEPYCQERGIKLKFEIFH